jgi:twinkle protein
MATLAEKLFDHGIRLRSYAEGSSKVICPRCSHNRTKRDDPCLSVSVNGEGALWKCHHCDWRGGVNEGEDQRRHGKRRHGRRERVSPEKPKRALGAITPAALAWLANRGISEAIARRRRVGFAASVWFPALNAKDDAIAFTYWRDGEHVNTKFRALSAKAFTQEQGAEATFYGLADLTDSKTVIIVEGECDKLACDEAGLENVLSVPNGAQATKGTELDPDAAAFAYLVNAGEDLARFERIVLAVDNDEKGRALE